MAIAGRLNEAGVGVGSNQLTARQTEINSELNYLRQAVAEQSSLLDSLGVALIPIIRRADVDPSKNGHPEELLVPLANEIRDSRKAINYHNQLINDLIQQIEL